jgi:F-type H+-transporting ATPase subunit epsilon
MSFSLEIISPQQTVFNDEIELCILPGIEGDFGILKNHMPFLTTLRIGIAYIYKNKNIIETFLVNGGIVEVSNNKCTLLSEDVVKTSDYKDQKTDDKIEIEKIRVSKKLYYY